MNGTNAYVLSRKFVENTAIGLGAVRGKNCTISSIVEEDNKSVVTFRWTGDDGTVQNSVMNVKNGISITDVSIDETTNVLTCTFSDGTTQEAGKVNVTTTANKIEYVTTKDSSVDNVKEALDKLFAKGLVDYEYTTASDASVTNVKQALDKAMDINVDTLEYENNVDATIDNVRGALDKLMVKTDSELEAPLTPNVQMGTLKSSYPKGTPLEEIIRDMLTEEIPPVVSITLSPSGTLYDVVNDSISSLTINATVTKKTYDIASIKYYVNDTLVKENTNCANGGSYPYIYNTTINSTTVIKVVVEDVEGLKNTVTKTITFVGRSYYGYIEPDVEITESVIKTLQNNVLQNTKTLTYSGITCAYHKVVYCYDKAFGELSTIVDPINNFSYTNSFEKKTITVDGIEKLCYTLIEPTGAENVTIKFS